MKVVERMLEFEEYKQKLTAIKPDLDLLRACGTGVAMGNAGEDVKAAGIARVLVAGEPDIPFLCNEAYEEHGYEGRSQSKGSEDREKIFEWV